MQVKSEFAKQTKMLYTGLNLKAMKRYSRYPKVLQRILLAEKGYIEGYFGVSYRSSGNGIE